MATAPNSFRPLAATEGSVDRRPDSRARTSRPGRRSRSAPTTATSATARPGAKPLNLPLITVGGANTDLVRRPPRRRERRPTRCCSASGCTARRACGFCCRTRRPTSRTCRPVSRTPPVRLGDRAGTGAGLTTTGRDRAEQRHGLRSGRRDASADRTTNSRQTITTSNAAQSAAGGTIVPIAGQNLRRRRIYNVPGPAATNMQFQVRANAGARLVRRSTA